MAEKLPWQETPEMDVVHLRSRFEVIVNQFDEVMDDHYIGLDEQAETNVMPTEGQTRSFLAFHVSNDMAETFPIGKVFLVDCALEPNLGS